MGERYAGWPNYETWAINNSVIDDAHWWERAAEVTEAYELGQEIKDDYGERIPELESPYADLLLGAFGEVDWFEIAERLIASA